MYCAALWLLHQESSASIECTMKIHLADIFYLFGESPSSIFPLHFSYVCFRCTFLLSQNCLQDLFQYLTYTIKCIIPTSRDICYILQLWVGYGSFFTNWIFSSNFAYIATEKPRSSAENIRINVSALSPSSTVIVLPIIWQI